jgi:glycogen debranching enzyme
VNRVNSPARRQRAGGAGFAFVLLIAALAADAAAPQAPLQFRITEGRILNAFHQDGPVAAHLLLTAGNQPRLLVAFPAGNSGVGLWFGSTQQPVRWTLGKVAAATRHDAEGRTLHGVVAEASVEGTLVVKDAVLSSVRVLRDYQIDGTYPAEVKAVPRITNAGAVPATIEWSRPRLDGAAGYALSISVENGELSGGNGTPVTLSAPQAGKELRLRITALTGEKPLTPLGTQLLGARANDDARSREVLSFLSYEEKLLAGSWRFNTYFGRDTLMSLRLLLPALEPEAVEGGLMAVLQRLAANGEVAHEEDIGEFAVLRHRKQGEGMSDAPIYDYNMIDDDYMLAPVAAAYLFEHSGGRARTDVFLDRMLPNGERVGAALARNFSWVVHSARSFAQSPRPRNLISLKAGLNAGEWRDSQDGLAGGRYPYDVNAVFVPAALGAIQKFVDSGALRPYLSLEQRGVLTNAGSAAAVWSREAPKLFRVRVANADARRQISVYATELGVDAKPALNTLKVGPIDLSAIALDAQLRPIPVLNSDGGFALLLQDPPAAEVQQLIDSMLRPFPAGLLTDAGLLVANPAFSDADRRRRLGRTAYHGTVTWSWQQAMLAAGLERQAARPDLPAATVERLRVARKQLWSVIENTRELRSSELWSWRFENGRYVAMPFGQNSGDADESNAAQLWSTVYLAIPGDVRGSRR